MSNVVTPSTTGTRSVGFFERFHEIHHERSELAAHLFNRWAIPQARFKAEPKDMHLFRPHLRGKFYGFEDFSDFGNDLRCLILKPFIFYALGLWEGVLFVGDIMSVPLNFFTASPGDAFFKLCDAVQSYVVNLVCQLMSTLEVFLQLGSLAMRTGLTVKELIIPNSNQEESVDEAGAHQRTVMQI